MKYPELGISPLELYTYGGLYKGLLYSDAEQETGNGSDVESSVTVYFRLEMEWSNENESKT